MASKKKYKDYESALERLEEITELLESGGAGLEESLKLYTEGLEIARYCSKKLDDAESKITMIAEQNGLFEETRFEEEDE